MNDLVQARGSRLTPAARPDLVRHDTASFATLRGWLFGRRARALAYAADLRRLREAAGTGLPHAVDILV